MEPIIDTPQWLLDCQPTAQRTPIEIRQLTDTIYNIAFEHVLEQTAANLNLPTILREYHTPIDCTKFRAWMLRDSVRKQRYYDAKAIGAECIEDEIFRIIDDTDSMEDLQRTKMRVDNRWKFLQIYDRKRYGDVKQLDITNQTTIDIKSLIEQRDNQLLNGVTLDGECRVESD